MAGSREHISLSAGSSFRLLRWNRNLQEVDVIHPGNRAERIPGAGNAWHFHQHMELTLFLTGEGTRFVGDHVGSIAPGGELVLLGSNLPHYWHAPGNSSGLSVQWDFSDGHPFWSLPEALAVIPLFRGAGAGRGLDCTGRTRQEIAHHMSEMAATGGLDRMGLLLRIFSALASAPRAEAKPLSTRSFALSAGTNFQQAMNLAVRYLLANFRDEVRMEEVLKLTGMTKPTFWRQFKKHSGKTFTEFLQDIRLNEACRQLLESKRSVIEISLSCGFMQISFFNRLFRRRYGCSPSEYREKKRRKRPVPLSP